LTISLEGDGSIRLSGVCALEEAEPLLRHLASAPDAVVDWRLCDRAHSAVIQVLLAGGAVLRGPPRGDFLSRVVEPLLRPRGQAERFPD
jgi:hypothetical protein